MTRLLRYSRYVVAVLSAAALCAQTLCAQDEAANNLQAAYARLSSGFAAAVPGWRPEPPQSGEVLFIAPDQYSQGDKPSSEHRDARHAYAENLFQLAKAAAEAGQLSLAMQWATETVRENPDHAGARRVLGYQHDGGRWLTAYGARMADAGKTWHPTFGWIVASDLPRYERGERLVGTRWLNSAAAAARHINMKNGWQVRTDHFLVTTNHSLEAAAELAARLERLHQVWRQLFAGFYLSEREVSALFAGERITRPQPRPFRVYYHRDQDEYYAALRGRQPRIAETLGIYFDAHEEAHFFAGANQDAGTLYHEAVHQLFQESRPSAKHIGSLANCWSIEGVATYFESLTEHNDPPRGLYYTIGESTTGRLPAARERLQNGFYLPLADLTRMGKMEIQEHADIAKLYSQSAGLSAFLMHGEAGRFREPLVSYLKAVYSGRDSSQSLPEATGESFDSLDAQYRRFMESLP